MVTTTKRRLVLKMTGCVLGSIVLTAIFKPSSTRYPISLIFGHLTDLSDYSQKAKYIVLSLLSRWPGTDLLLLDDPMA
jgi:hypothetical protein